MNQEASREIMRQVVTTVWGPAQTGGVLVAERRGTALWRIDTATGPYALKITTPCEDPQGHTDSELLAAVEAELLIGLQRDEAVVPLYRAHGFLPDEAGSWLVLRWIVGADAESAFAKLRSHPEPQRAATYAGFMCRAVADLHGAGWLHGDLQEPHFLITPTRAVLLDFAMAHSPGRAVGKGAVACRGAYDFFMSPELAHARRTTAPADNLVLTRESEVWSLCAVIYACWSGHYPISSKDTTQTTPDLHAELATGHVKPWDAVAPWPFARFERLTDRGLQHDPARRPSARSLQYAFETLARTS
ncbi:protein kinase domain-containing protein [Streptomyces sp. NPDC055099]